MTKIERALRDVRIAVDALTRQITWPAASLPVGTPVTLASDDYSVPRGTTGRVHRTYPEHGALHVRWDGGQPGVEFPVGSVPVWAEDVVLMDDGWETVAAGASFTIRSIIEVA